MADPIQAVADTAKRITENFGSANAKTKTEVAGNRAVSGVSTVVIGGSIAAILTYYLRPPEPLHSHVDALILFGWNSAVYFGGVLWRKHFGDSES